jgi:transposase
MVLAAHSLDSLNAQQLREFATGLMARLAERESMIVRKDKEIVYRDTKIGKFTHEIAVLRRHQFGRKSEQLNGVQGSLLDEAVAADIAAIELELEQLATRPKTDPEPRNKPKRTALPAAFPRIDHHHEPESTTCSCGCQLKRIGEDVSEKLDYTPGLFRVERHVRGKWVCTDCQTLTQAPVPAHVIDKGLPTTGLLAQVLVAKYADHAPLYRQEKIFARAGLALSRSTLAQWVGVCGVQLQPLVDALREAILARRVLHADETPVQMLTPGKEKTHRAYLWAYTPGAFEDLRAVVYDFAESRSGEHARAFFGDWRGSPACDDYVAYKRSFTQGITEVGCMAHARRKLFDLHEKNQSPVAQQALRYIALLYETERQVRDLDPEHRRQVRQEHARPVALALHTWMLSQRQLVPDGSTIAKALDYSLKRRVALTRYLDDGQLAIDNNWVHAAGSMNPIMSPSGTCRLEAANPYSYSMYSNRLAA